VELYFWEPGSGAPLVEFRPDTFVELSADDVRTKQKSLDGYVSQFPPGTLTTFAADRAHTYGALVGVPYAEPFRKAFAYPLPENPWCAKPGYIELLERRDHAPQVIRL